MFRSMFRFSIRELLMLAVIVALTLGWLLDSRHKTKALDRHTVVHAVREKEIIDLHKRMADLRSELMRMSQRLRRALEQQNSR